MFYRTEPLEFLETLKSEWANTRDEFLRVFDERGRASLAAALRRHEGMEVLAPATHEVWSDADQHRVVIIMDFDNTDLSKIAGLGQNLRLRGGQSLIAGRGRPQRLLKCGVLEGADGDSWPERCPRVENARTGDAQAGRCSSRNARSSATVKSWNCPSRNTRRWKGSFFWKCFPTAMQNATRVADSKSRSPNKRVSSVRAPEKLEFTILTLSRRISRTSARS